MTVSNATLSTKSLGKRPAKASATISSSVDGSAERTATPTDEAGSASAAAQARQTRRLPARSRRGGPGIGSCDVDVGILDSLQRRGVSSRSILSLTCNEVDTGENEPLIPSSTVFVLTTDSSFVPPASTSELGVNAVANERYFERPEVIKAFKEQRDIQTPEFVQLSDDARVGGRLRARTQEIVSVTVLCR